LDEKILKLIQIAKKGNFLVFGKEGMRKYIISKQIYKVIIVANNISEKIYRDYLCRTENKSIEILKLKKYNKKEIGKAIGLNEIAALGIIDVNIAKEVLKIAKTTRR